MLDERREVTWDPGSTRQMVIRTGCISCRARGVRCDPKNQQCQQNISTRWISNRQLAKRRWHESDPGSRSGRSSSILALNLSWQGSLREKESLHFFCVISAPELSGFLDMKFWRRLLPQAAYLDPAIKHAVAAIGACHEWALRKQASRFNAETDGIFQFGLRQCNKAIKTLLRPSYTWMQADFMRTLTLCILLATFESLSGSRESAIPHIVHSRHVLEQHREKYGDSDDPGDFPVNLNTLEPLIAHYETQIGSFVYEDDPNGMKNVFDLAAPMDYRTLVDARISLEQAIANFSVVIWSLRDQHSSGDLEDVVKPKVEYAIWFRRWEVALTALLAKQSSGWNRETLDGCRLLKAHHLAISTLADVDYSLGEMGWAVFTPQYATIVELISTIVNHLPKRGLAAQAPQLPYLTSTVGMTEPLYVVATRCTDPAVAEKARTLMKKLPLSEGVHSAWKISFIEKTLCAATGKYYSDDHQDQDSNAMITPKTAVTPVDSSISTPSR